MRLFKYIWTPILLLALLTACRPSEAAEASSEETDWSVLQMAEAVWDSQPGNETAVQILPEDGLYETYLTANYQIALEDVEDAAILSAGGASASETAVLRLSEEAAAAQVEAALRDYLQRRAADFTGYLPQEEERLENAAVLLRGRYAVLMVCDDQTAARAALDVCFTGAPPETEDSPEPAGPQPVPQEEPPAEPQEPPVSQLSEEPEESAGEPAPEDAPAAEDPAAEEPPQEAPPDEETAPAGPENTVETAPGDGAGQPWSYDASRLLQAWQEGSWDTLPQEDQEILNRCAEVVQTAAPDGLSEYEKELAIHDWMLSWGSYDSNSLSLVPDFKETPHHDNPYGFLISRRGICTGYTTTFQLFMDLLGIECVTVQGHAYNGATDHAWNMVRLDGDWYCVDVTWDDPSSRGTVSAQTAHRYFNVTSEFMRQTDHQWDKSAAAEATATAYAWK